MIINEDCVEVEQHMESSSVDMIHLEPPFFTQKVQALKDVQGKEYSFEDVWSNRNE